MSKDFLRRLPLFSDLNDTDLDKLQDLIEELSLAPGEILFEEGNTADSAYIIKSGQVEILKASGDHTVLLAIRESGNFIGEVALIQDTSRTATVRAVSAVKLIKISRKVFDELISISKTAAKSIFHTILARLHSTESLLKENEKLAQLGTLSAGLAHEINNPASAILRGVNTLNDLIEDLINLQVRLSEIKLSPDDINRLIGIIVQLKEKALKPPILDPIIKSDLESEMEEVLEKLEVDNIWEIAPSIVETAFSPEEVFDYFSGYPKETRQIIIYWLAKIYLLITVRNEVSQGAERVTSIVKALKGYAYLDQAPLQSVNIHEGLDNTLIILKNKFKDRITIKREYYPELPTIQAYGSELNQVWTNIIDNAIDALEDTEHIKNGTAQINIRTSTKGKWILVEIEDNGPGIPEEVKKRIFDPFFTTKPPGKGTGLGLDISHKIIFEKHRGDIKIISKPGYTCFRVFLPFDVKSVEGLSPIDEYRILDDKRLLYILKSSKIIAVYGYSNSIEKPSYSVPIFLRNKSYFLVGIDPNVKQFQGNPVFKNLREASQYHQIDVVLIFSDGKEAPAIVQQAIDVGAKSIWMQEGVINEYAAMMASDAGLDVVMDKCMRNTYQRLYT